VNLVHFRQPSLKQTMSKKAQFAKAIVEYAQTLSHDTVTNEVLKVCYLLDGGSLIHGVQ